MSLIELKNVNVTYLHRQEKALTEVSLSIDKGEFVGLLGPLLSGKTTLLHLLNGLIPHVIPARIEGEVLVDGKNPRDFLVAEMSEHVGMVLDDPTVQVFSLTVKDDISFGPLNLGMPLDEIEERVAYAAEVTRLKPLLMRHPKELSGGQQQALSLAGVLAMRPKVLALDEPISMLDPIGKSLVLEEIKELNEKYGLTCIIAESGADLEDVLNIVTRVVVLDSGRIVFDGDPDEAVRNDVISRCGVGNPHIAELALNLLKMGVAIEVPASIDRGEAELRRLLVSGKLKVKDVKPNHKTAFRGAPLVEAKHVSFIYPNGVKALNDVSITLYEGELTAFIGQNGSGKSTLALTLVGVYKPTNRDAEIKSLGIDVVKADPKEIVKRVNYVFQNPNNMLFSRTVFEEVSFGLKNMRYPPGEIPKLVEKTLNLLGIIDAKDTLIIELPRFLRTLVALASVLVLEPRLVIIDEPTSGLDRKDSLRLMEILNRLKSGGITPVIITHDMRLVSEFADRVVVMSEGRIILDGPPADVFSRSEILSTASIKPPQITQLAHRLRDFSFRPDTITVQDFLNQLEVM
ncbi:MAG: energy-coupling factor transporter ATPase [Candidatus Caldarchaeum sp.]|nr:energy-coupling factor transporter ATPase [Candidatus Caldarchaeum sp.]